MIKKYIFNCASVLGSIISVTACQTTAMAEYPLLKIEQLAIIPSKVSHLDQTISPLTIEGENFIDSSGNRVRFWGMNLTSFYPTHEVAERTAQNLASLGINMVRPHHMLRPSRDWNPTMISGALVDYQDDSRQFDTEALDRFDYLNAKLREKGIYLSFAIGWTRTYKPGDVDILQTTPEDARAWQEGLKELKSWHWRKQHDVVKSLSLIDERFMAIDNEFATKLFSHVNPYTQISYAQDPQVATLEVINEYGAEYTFICNNRFPAYFHNKLQAKWDEYSRANGLDTSDFYKPDTHQQRLLRLDFMVSLDKARLERVKTIVRDLGFNGAITYSNLFRGENLMAMQEASADYTEDHTYPNPFIVNSTDDAFYKKTRTLLKDKPYILSEFNTSLNEELREEQKNKRTMLTAATVAYGSMNNWSGVDWFAWQHGTNQIGTNGWSTNPNREPNIGNIARDQMQLDHFRTAATIFRNGYLEAAEPKILHVDAPYKYSSYYQLIDGKYQFKRGWQNIVPIRKTFTPIPSEDIAAQIRSDWMTQTPISPLISTTGQIVKDIDRKQLTAVSPKAEIFTGYLDDLPQDHLHFMQLNRDSGLATVMITSNDGEDLSKSHYLLLSKTYFEQTDTWLGLSSEELESDQLSITLNTDYPNSDWVLTINRPESEQGSYHIATDGRGRIEIPEVKWYEMVITKVPR